MERTVTIREVKVTVKELTVADVRAWLKEMSQGVALDLVGDGLFQDQNGSLRDVLLMTDADAGELDQMTPAEVSQILDKCQKVNPHFFTLRARLIRDGEQTADPTPNSSAKR